MINFFNSDLTLVFIYFVVLLAVGYATSRKQKSEDYLIAARNLGPLSTMATINASKTGSILMVFVAMVYMFGFSAIWYFVGMTLGILLFLPFALRLKDSSKGKFYTLADYFKYNYGKASGIAASLMTIFLMFGVVVLNLIAATKIFVFFFAWPFWLCAIIVMLVVTGYLLLGGFKAVVKTDIIQYGAMIFILGILTFILAKSSIASPSEWGLFQVDIPSLAGFFILGILYPFSMPELWQRVYSAKDKKTLKKGILMSAGVYFVFALFLALVAMGIKTNFPGIDPELALIHGFKELLPAGILGLSVVMLFSAIMSSLDTYIFTGASSVVQDLSNAVKGKAVRNIKIAIIIFGILGTTISILIQSLAIGAYIFVSFAIILSVISFATWIKKNIKETTLLFGFVFGFLGVLVFLTINLLTDGLTPLIVMVGLFASVLGLIVGGVVGRFKKA